MRKYIYVLFLGFFLMSPAVVYACECMATSKEDAIKKADVIFTGLSLKKQELAHSMVWSRFYPVQIDKLNKNAAAFFPKTPHDTPTEVLVMQNFSKCSFPFEKGKAYKIYASVQQTSGGTDYLLTDRCAGTVEVSAPASKQVQKKKVPAHKAVVPARKRLVPVHKENLPASENKSGQ